MCNFLQLLHVVNMYRAAYLSNGPPEARMLGVAGGLGARRAGEWGNELCSENIHKGKREQLDLFLFYYSGFRRKL